MEEHDREDIARRIGSAIVFGIPTFVGAGIVWDLVGMWTAVIAWVVVAGICVLGLIGE